MAEVKEGPKVSSTLFRSRFFLFLFLFAPFAACTPALRGPNVLLVSFDTTRADRLGCYGYAAACTPNFDRIAAEGVRFQWAFTPTPITLPAHTSLFTGLYPTAHGVRTNGTFRLAGKAETLAEVFRRAGYATAAFVGSIVLEAGYGLDQGFELYQDDMVTGGRRAGLLGNRELRAEEVTRRALEWLHHNGLRKPFFLFVHYFDPHQPYEAPEEFSARFADPYDAEIAYTDFHFGRLLAALDSLQLAGNTVVVVLSDHGEGLGDHGEQTHSTFIYNSTARIPLAIRVPWIPALAGTVEKTNVSLVDVAATLAELCGIEPPQGHQGEPLLKETGVNPPPVHRPIYLECYYTYFAHGWSPLEAVVQNKWKYILAPQVELYDLASDPGELHNLALSNPVLADSLAHRLALLKQRLTPAGGVPGAWRAALETEEEQKLRALGYAAARYARVPNEFSHLPDPKEMIKTFKRYMLGLTFMSDGRLDLAAKEFSRLLEEDPNNYEVSQFLAETELLRSRPRQALQAALRATKAAQPTQRSFFLVGLSYLVLGDSTAALENLDRCLELDEGYRLALLIKGRMLDAAGKYEEALPLLERALAENETNPDMLTELGVCLIHLGRLERAIEVLVKANNLEDSGWETAYNLGIAYQLSGEIEKAVRAYREAAEINGASLKLFNNLGICLFSLERYEESRKAYEKALALDSSYAEAWNNLAGTLAALGRTKEAEAHYCKALELDTLYADACVNYGILLAESLNNPDSAFKMLARGIHLAPDNPRNPVIERLMERLR